MPLRKFLCVLLWAFCLMAQADDYVRITQARQLVSGGQYVVATYAERVSTLLAMRSVWLGKHFRTCSLADNLANRLTEVPDDVVWTLEEDDGKWLISRGGDYLAADGGTNLKFTNRTGATRWTIAESGGHFLINAGSEAKRYLLCERVDKATYVFGHYVWQNYMNAVTLYARTDCDDAGDTDDAAKADSMVTGSQKVLSGLWSAEALSQVEWSGIRVLDLRKLELPDGLLPFQYRPKNENTLVLVNAQSASLVPAEWTMVVSCSEDGNDLLRGGTIYDGDSLEWPFAFGVGQGQLAYSRPLASDGGYETLCLPFDAAMPDDVQAYALDSLSTDSAYFVEADTLKAGQACLLRYVGAETEPTLRLSSLAGHVAPLPAQGPLQGLYGALQVGEDGSGRAFLDEDGTAFVVAAGSSRLPAFRAYLNTKSSEGSKMRCK